MATNRATRTFPLPGGGPGPATVVVPAPGPGPQQWAGAPNAVLDHDGSVVLAYRVRAEEDFNVVARSTDGERFTTVATFSRDSFGAAMVERPALVRLPSGGWRMYVCGATPASKHWWIGAIGAPDLEGLSRAEVQMVFPGDELTGVKDPVVRLRDGLWEAWICCHPLDVPGAEDRMSTAYATSRDGLDWAWHGTVLAGRPGEWDARGARLTTVLADGRASYDGRATAEENWFERTGLAVPSDSGALAAGDGPPVADVRYLDVLELPDGGYRIYYEARLPDESHELRTELIAP